MFQIRDLVSECALICFYQLLASPQHSSLSYQEVKYFFIGPLDAYVLNCVLVFKTTLLFPFIGKNVEKSGRNFKDTLVLVVYKVIDLSKK